MDAASVINGQEKLRGARANWDTMFQEVADRVWPQMADFVQKRSPGEKRTEKMFDSTAPMALERGSSAFHALMVPDSQMWHGLSIGKDQGLMENVSMKTWLDDIAKVLFRMRRSPKANFSGQAQECIRSLLGFGTQSMFTEDVPGRGMRYKSIHLAEIDCTENKDAMVDTVFRRFEFTARQAVEAFGLDKLPEKIRNAYEKKDETSKFDFIHHVYPNPQRKVNRITREGMKYLGCYVSVEGKAIVEEGGYRRFPYHISRYATNPREVYGRGPAIVLLPDIKLLNEQEKTSLRAGHLAVDPPLLLWEDGSLQGFQMRPRALNYGGLNERGEQMVQPLQTGANLPWVHEMLVARRKLISEGFWVMFFQALLDNPSMTATQAMLLAQQSGQFLASPVGRQQTEWLGPMIRREVDVAIEMGLIPQPPEEVVELLQEYVEVDSNGVNILDLAEKLEIEYTSPLSRLIRSEDATAIMRTFEQIAPFAQVDPTVFDEFHPQRTAAELAEINGVPSKVRRTEKEKQQLAAERAARQQAADTLAAAEVASNAGKNVAQAAATAASVPQRLPALEAA